MDSSKFSLKEFEMLFPDRFESPEQLRREYRSFLAVLEQLDQAPVPELSNRQKEEIFRRAWQDQRRDWSWTWAWQGILQRPTVTFAAGIVLGCAAMFLAMNSRTSPVEVQVDGPLAKSESPLTIEHIQRTQVYKGKAVERMYPGIENPQIVVEKTEESAKPQRVLYGTLDGGEIYVVWNL